MRDAAMPVLRDLAQELQETVHLSVLAGDRLQMLGFAYSAAHSMTVRMEDADTLPFHATSSGLCLLAFGPETLAQRVLVQPLARLTDQTETNPARLSDTVAQVRTQGFASITGGFESGVASLALPVFGPEGCIGALAVAVPEQRLTPELSALIRATLPAKARRITDLWGGHLPPDLHTLWQALGLSHTERA
jgi:IclR family transcriptional regulator, acetate operon repressor